MKEDLNNYDCDKIAVPLGLRGKCPKASFYNSLIDVLIVVAFFFSAGSAITSGVFLGIEFYHGKDFSITKYGSGKESITINSISVFNISPTEIEITAKDSKSKSTKKKKFNLTPLSRMQLQSLKKDYTTEYTFYYTVKEKNCLLETIEEIK